MSIFPGLVAAAAVVALALPAISAADATEPLAQQPARFSVAFDAGARLGAPTALHMKLHIDTKVQPSPLRIIKIYFPGSLGFQTSGLGLETCHRSVDDFTAIVINEDGWLAGCPRNSVMATGDVRAKMYLNGKPGFIPEVGTVTVLAGPPDKDTLGVVALVDGWNPIGAKLAFAGKITPASGEYGGALAIHLPRLPDDWGASVALTDMSFDLGARDIIYHERVGGQVVRYRPEGIGLPSTCPRGGFRFLAALEMENGQRSRIPAVARCPTRVRR